MAVASREKGMPGLILFGVAVLVSFHELAAVEFSAWSNHCADLSASMQSGRGQLSSGQRYVWGEGGTCLAAPLAMVLSAMERDEFVVWRKVTRLVSRQAVAADWRAADVTRQFTVEYEARHFRFFKCWTAQWPMQWSYTAQFGSDGSPVGALILYERVAGGNALGGHIRYWQGRVEVTAIGDRVSVHIRQQIDATGENEKTAASTVEQFLVKLSRLVAGEAVEVLKQDPRCS
jgi:hypothetical protein